MKRHWLYFADKPRKGWVICSKADHWRVEEQVCDHSYLGGWSKLSSTEDSVSERKGGGWGCSSVLPGSVPVSLQYQNTNHLWRWWQAWRAEQCDTQLSALLWPVMGSEVAAEVRRGPGGWDVVRLPGAESHSSSSSFRLRFINPHACMHMHAHIPGLRRHLRLCLLVGECLSLLTVTVLGVHKKVAKWFTSGLN